jgi:hypothetical protein
MISVWSFSCFSYSSEYAIPQVYGEAKAYMKYQLDASTLVVPMERPVLSKTNDKQLEFKGWF